MPKLSSKKATLEERNLLHHFLGFFFFFNKKVTSWGLKKKWFGPNLFLFVYLRRWGRKAFHGRSIIAVTLKVSYHKKAELESSQDSRFNCQLAGHVKNKGHSVHDVVDNVMFLVWHMLNSKVFIGPGLPETIYPHCPSILIKSSSFHGHMCPQFCIVTLGTRSSWSIRQKLGPENHFHFILWHLLNQEIQR